MTRMFPRIIATMPPHVAHRHEIASHPLVTELRYNTVSPLGESIPNLIKRLRAESAGKRLWLDLKGRQLRIAKFAYLPYAYVELNHAIRVDLPTSILFKNGPATIVKIVDGNKLILEDRPGRVVGEGEPVNILDPSLEIEGYFSPLDLTYVQAAKAEGMHDYMLSFVEQRSDILQILKIDARANIVAKIESQRGLAYIRSLRRLRHNVRLMAARDDLYINLRGQEIEMLPALQDIVRCDPTAICASRLLSSLETQERVSLADLNDVELMRRIGFCYLMLSDGLCFNKDSFNRAMALIERLASQLTRTR